MSCENVRELISPLLDQQVGAGERRKVLAHLQACRKCKSHMHSVQELRQGLRSMKRPAVPTVLASRLRVTASHERQRQLVHSHLSMRLREWAGRLQLAFDNLMRPLALPFAGGTASAVVCFSILLPILSFPHNVRDATFFTGPDGTLVVQGVSGTFLPNEFIDVPRIERMDGDNPENANVVELTIDESGRVTDWSVLRGKLTPDIQSIIMFSKFSPATYLGTPTSGKVKAVQFIPTRSMRS